MKRFLTVVLSVMMLISCTVLAAPVMVGTVQETTQEMQVGFVQNEAPAQLYAEENLIYQIDFEKIDNGTFETDVRKSMSDLDANGGSYEPVSFGGFEFMLRKPTTAGVSTNIASVASDDVNGKSSKVMLMSPSTAEWHRFYIYPGKSGFPAGEYTVKLLVKPAATSSYAFTVKVDGAEPLIAKSLASKWNELTYTFTVAEDLSVTFNGSTYPKIGWITFAAQGHATQWSFDDLKIYYRPVTSVDYTISFDANGKNVTVPEDLTIPAGSSTTLQLASIKMPDAGDARFAGWAPTADGKAVSDIDITMIDKLYAVWDENYYPAKNETLNIGELIATLDFNDVSVTALPDEIQKFGVISDSQYVNKTESTYQYPALVPSNESRSRIFPYVSAQKSNSIGDGTLSANRGKDNDLLLVSDRNAGEADNFQVGITCTKSATVWDSKFSDGIYTLAAEVLVESNKNIAKAQSYSYAQYYDTKANVLTASYTDIPMGERIYVKKSVLVANNTVYDYDTMKPVSAYDGKMIHLALGFLLTHTEDATGKISATIHVDNLKLYYNPNYDVPKAYVENSIRVKTPSGIRFMSSVTKEMKTDEKTTEYGFIVTRSTLLGDKNDDYLTFEQTDVKYVSGVSYGTVNGERVDKIFSEDTYNLYFTAAITGIKADKGSYMEDLVVRPYIIKHDGETIYGSAMRRSVYDVAVALKANGYTDLDEEGIAMVNSILAICEQ